jgi:hypothetical protein
MKQSWIFSSMSHSLTYGTRWSFSKHSLLHAVCPNSAGRIQRCTRSCCTMYLVINFAAFRTSNYLEMHSHPQAEGNLDSIWNVMAHTQKPDFSFWKNGHVHLIRWGLQFSRLLAAKVCASAVVMLDTPCSEVVWRVLATHSICQFPIHFPTIYHHVPSHFNWTLPPVWWCGIQTQAQLSL